MRECRLLTTSIVRDLSSQILELLYAKLFLFIVYQTKN